MNTEEIEKYVADNRFKISRNELMRDAERIQKNAITKDFPTSCIPVVKGHVRRDRQL